MASRMGCPTGGLPKREVNVKERNGFVSRHRVVLSTILLALCSSSLMAEVSLPAVFSDHMVLQQGVSNPVWGWGSPAEEVSIEMAGQRHRAIVGSDGTWRTDLAPLNAGGPYVLSVQGRNLVTIEDVLVGEVWLASGQSNMEFPVSRTVQASETIAGSGNSRIRLFQVARHSALETAAHTPSRWEVCGPESVGEFSAVAYLFGRRLQETLGVPVGIINASWGGTSAEEWTRRADLESEPSLEPILDRWERVDPGIPALFKGNLDLELWLDDVVFLPVDPEGSPLVLDNFEDGDLSTSLFGAWTASPPSPWGPTRIAVEDGESRTLHFTAVTRPGSPSSVEVRYAPGRYIDLSRYHALRFRCRGKGFLRLQSLQPDVVDFDNYAARAVRLTPEWQTLTVPFDELAQAGWGKPQAFTPKRLSGAVFEVQPAPFLPRPPVGLFNGMIHPLVPFGVRGVLWYQGESNAPRAYQYRRLLPVMIGSWRTAWKAPDLSFLIVQLPNFRARRPEPSDTDWAELREAQLLTALGDEHVGLAVTIDLGEDDDIHPKDKLEVGRRLALLAERQVYGRDVVASGPLYRSAHREGSAMVVGFSATGSGLVSAGGAPLRGFAIAGQDRRFHWADARIEGGNVVVSSPEVPEPVAVRYAWGDNPDCSLYNREGLPASPFRTDDWPGITMDRK